MSEDKKARKRKISPVDIPTRSEINKRKLYTVIKLSFALFMLICIAISSFHIGVAIASTANELPDVSLLEDHKPAESTLIYDINDKLVANIHGDEDRVVVPLNKISKNLQKAVISTEDDVFYEHHGIDLKGIFRAMLINLAKGDSVQGGSTITQQMVKNLFLSPEKNIKRKIAEAILAVRVESRYDKDTILELYLNQVYWGNRSYGIEKAAKRYFRTSAANLNLAQSALLAGLLKAPSQYSPYSNFDSAKKRQMTVLGKMLKDGFITQKQYEEAANYKFDLAPSYEQPSKYSYFVTYVISELEKTYGKDVVRRGGLRVYTTLDPEVQELGEKVIKNAVKRAPKYSRVRQGALITIDVDKGYVSAIVGGKDFSESNFNRATQSYRALGSSFKPVVYLAAFRKGLYTPNSPIRDEPITISDGWTSWSPHNWDNKYYGSMTVRSALYLSRNTPTVRVAYKLGTGPIIETAKDLGIKTKLEPNLSIALGSAGIPPIELATAFSTIARGGIRIDPIVIRRVEDSFNNIIEENKAHPVKAIDTKPVNDLISILEDVVKRGTGTRARLSDRVVAGKTGSSDDFRDIWFTGFTPDMVTTIWLGNDENKPLKGVFSSRCAEEWKNFAQEYYKIKSVPATKFDNGTTDLLTDKINTPAKVTTSTPAAPTSETTTSEQAPQETPTPVVEEKPAVTQPLAPKIDLGEG